MLSKLSGINAINKKNTISYSLSDIASANKHKMSLRELIIIALSLNAAKNQRQLSQAVSLASKQKQNHCQSDIVDSSAQIPCLTLANGKIILCENHHTCRLIFDLPMFLALGIFLRSGRQHLY